MFLEKLKAAWAVALALVIGAGAVGLTYQKAGAQDAPARPGTRFTAGGSAAQEAPRGGRAAADELEELRLEVAALRKGLEATRARVKALETEVRALKGPGKAPAGATGEFSRRPSYLELRSSEPSARHERFLNLSRAKGAPDPLDEAERLLRRIREHPEDREAAQRLEQAVKRLRERGRPKGPTGPAPRKEPPDNAPSGDRPGPKS